MSNGFLIAPLVIVLLIFGTISPIWASVNFNGYLSINGDPEKAQYQFQKSIFIDYPNGGKLKTLLENKNITISFTDNSTVNQSIRSFMDQINTDIHLNRHSTANLTNLVVKYAVVITGDSNRATLDYSITLVPTVSNYLFFRGSGNTPTTLDASWLAFNASSLVPITTNQYKDLEINYPIGVIKNQLPDVYSVIKDTDAAKVMQSSNLIDATPLFEQQPLDKWDYLFDPAYTLAETTTYGYKGEKIGLTTYSSGSTNVMIKHFTAKNIDMDFTADTKCHISTLEHTSGGSINVEGHANAYQIQGGWALSTTVKAEQGAGNVSGLSTATIYGMAGMAIVLAGGIFFWSNRKMKQALHKRDTGPTGPIEYEERKHWADRFDEDKKHGHGKRPDEENKSLDDNKKSPI